MNIITWYPLCSGTVVTFLSCNYSLTLCVVKTAGYLPYHFPPRTARHFGSLENGAEMMCGCHALTVLKQVERGQTLLASWTMRPDRRRGRNRPQG